MNSEIARLEEERAEQINAIEQLVNRKELAANNLPRWLGKINAKIDERIRAIRITQPAKATKSRSFDEAEEIPSPNRFKRPRISDDEDDNKIQCSAVSEHSNVKLSEWDTEEADDADEGAAAGSIGDSNTLSDDSAVDKSKLSGSDTELEDDDAQLLENGECTFAEGDHTREDNLLAPPRENRSKMEQDKEPAVPGANADNNGRSEREDPGTAAAKHRGADREDSDYNVALEGAASAGLQRADRPVQDVDDLDLQYAPEPELVREKIRRSKLSIAMQGFRTAKDTKKRRSSSASQVRCKPPTFDPEQVHYHKKTFHKGQCYRYKEKGASIEVTVGIQRFVSKKKAVCVLIVPFEDTFLGMNDPDDEYVPDYKPTAHCQVYDHVSTLKLKRFLGEASDLDGLPEWVYEPQSEGKWNRFGYFLDNAHQIRRTGRRGHMQTLELFSGAGGMHLGFKNAGFTATAVVDNDKFATATMRMNCPETPVFHEDVTSFLSRHEDSESRKLLGPVDVIATTAPCQGFSGLNRNGGRNDKRNNDLSLTAIDAARIFQPTVLVFENVLGMWRRKHVHYLKNIVKGLMQLGYQVRVAQLRACDFGSAQKRPRLIILATHRSVPPPKFPANTHGDDEYLLPYVNNRDILSGLEDGLDCDGNPLRNTRHTTTTREDVDRLEEDGLAPAICASRTPPLHYQHDRCLTVRECAALQDFPTNFRISGSTLAQQYKQVGNAVPVELATKIAQAVREIVAFEYER